MDHTGIRNSNLGVKALRCKLHEFFKQETVKQYEGEPQKTSLTIISSAGNVAYADLGEFDLEGYNRKQRRKLAKLLPTDVRAIGAVDVCLQYRENKRTHWNFHLSYILSRELSNKELDPIRAAWKADEEAGILKPVMQKRIKEGGLEKMAGYTCKYFFTRRSQFTAISANRADHQANKDLPLSAKETRYLEEYLSQCPVKALVSLIGFKMKRTKSDTEFKLMKTQRN